MTNERTGLVAAHGLRAAARTDTGRRHEDNEDRYFLDVDAGIFLVVDGIGGQAAGEIAASIAVETIRRRLERQDAPADVRIREAITLANQQILTQARASAERRGMACVLTLAILEGRRLTVGHVGDTRLYRLGPDGIAKLTHDHSPVGEREDAREISETEAMHHARRNEVYRDVGSEPREPDTPDFIETIVVDVRDDWALLFCSDGLSDMLPSLELDRVVRTNAGNPIAVVDALIDAANEAGGRDNITAIYVEAPRFAGREKRVQVPPYSRAGGQVATTPLADVGTLTASTGTSIERDEPTSASRAFGGRTLALLAGAVLGFAAAVGLGMIDVSRFWNTSAAPISPRVLTVGNGAPESFTRIADALAEARDGDTIAVYPGRYPETLEIRRNVRLISTQPRGAALVPPAGTKAIASITAWAPATVRGFRITGSGTAGHVGIRVHAGDVEIDDVLLEGALQIGVDVAGEASSVLLHASRLAKIEGVPVQVAKGARAMLRQNVLHAPDGWRGPAIVLTGGTLGLDANVFVHFAELIVGSSPGTPVPDPTYVIPVPPAAARTRAR